MAWTVGDGHPDMHAAETGFTVLLEACDRSIEVIGAAVPPVQLRALLIIDRTGKLNLNRLAAALGASASAASRLCDRMEAAGLLSRDRAASRREIVLILTEAGTRLAAWVREQRQAALERILAAMSPEGRAALARGLDELAVGRLGRLAAPRGGPAPSPPGPPE